MKRPNPRSEETPDNEKRRAPESEEERFVGRLAVCQEEQDPAVDYEFICELERLDEEEEIFAIIGGAAGSMLWMAPELVLGEKYTEKVDVFSYAMCLVELVDRNVPWHGSGVGQQVIPVRLTQGKRPTHQLNKTEPTLKQLIVECWDQSAAKRPAFPEIVERLQAMRDELDPTRKSALAHDSIAEGDEEEEQGYSRPVSPSRRGGAE